jgi:hypothetical protein
VGNGSQPKVSSTSRAGRTHEHEYEQRAHRRGCTELVEGLPQRCKELAPLMDGVSTLDPFLGLKAPQNK